MLLSIVLMVKNEERFLDKTLSALNKLRDQLNTELVILDTGSTDKTVAIAKKYTDKVYFEKWNNNFADMRNKSISYAKGDWLLILDADEELIECEKMIIFFKSDLYKKYNSASIELKNIVSDDFELYTKFMNMRLFKNEGFKYKGSIHEQAMYKEPVYNNLASFNHYGYLYIDEEFKQQKLKRNEIILLNEFNKKPDDAYISFQLGKNFMAQGKKKDAIYFIERSINIHRKLKFIPEYVYSNLANFYFELRKFSECENICLEYIKNKDDKNIDIYYFLAASQSGLYKYKESIESYKRYLFLLENYEMSTQANSLYAEGNTVGFAVYVKSNIIKNYYYLDEYKKVIKLSRNLDYNEIKELYEILFYSLYKVNSLNEILNIYNKNKNSKLESKYIENSLERFILKVKESDREKIYQLLSNIEDNYGLLNKIRINEKLSLKQLNQILIEGKESYYGDVIYYAVNNNLNLIELFKNISYTYIQGYFNYITIYKQDCIQKLYDYLINQNNTLDLNKLNIYTCLAKALLINASLYNNKYEKVFNIYINYRYEVIKQIYNTNLSNEELLNLVTDRNDEFVLRIKNIQKLKNNEPLKYIKEMRNLLLEYKEYKKVIEILIDKFKEEFDESEELKNLKKQYKLLIENSINQGNIEEALIMINEYENMYSADYEILNMKSIINIMKKNYEEAELLLKESLMLNSTNENTIFNIAYLKELKNEISEAIMFYKKIMDISNKEEVIIEAKEKIRCLN